MDSVSLTEKYDATFIRILLEILYKDDIKTLLHRSFSGRTTKPTVASGSDVCLDDTQTEHKAISPKKKSDIFLLFKHRILHANISKQEQLKRLQATNISRIVAVGISNLRKKV